MMGLRVESANRVSSILPARQLGNITLCMQDACSIYPARDPRISAISIPLSSHYCTLPLPQLTTYLGELTLSLVRSMLSMSTAIGTSIDAVALLTPSGAYVGMLQEEYLVSHAV